MSTKMEIYTVYRHTNPLNNEVFYIGKGTDFNKRRNMFWNNRNDYYLEVLKSITDANLTPIVEVLNTTTEEETAFYLEQMHINYHGRKDLNNGTLVNLTDGGLGALNPSQEARNRLAEARKGKKHSAESRKKISEATTGKNNPRYGKSLSDDTKLKIGKAHKGRVFSAEARKKMSISLEAYWADQKISEARKGENHHNYGKKHSDETKRKMSESGKNKSDETRKKMSEARTSYWANKKLKAS